MRKLLTILFLVGFSNLYSQSLIQTYVDRCTGAVNVFTVPMNGQTTVVFYNKSRTFTSQQFQNGELQAWLEETYLWWSTLNPCSTATTGAVATQQQTQQTTQQATTAATNAATSAPPPVQTSTTGTTNPTTNDTSTQNTTGTTQSSGSTDTGGSTSNTDTGSSGGGEGTTTNDSGGTTEGGSSDGGSTETETKTEETKTEETKTEETKSEEKTEEVKEEKKEESKEEEKSEEKEEEKKEEEKEEEEEKKEEDKEEEKKEEEDKKKKKKKKRTLAPPIISANMLTQQSPLGGYDVAASFGVSQSSLMGDKTYGLNAMVYSNLQQFMLTANYSQVHINKEGRISRVYSASVGGMKMFSTVMGMMNHSIVFLGKKGSAAGFAFGTSLTSIELDVRGGLVFYDDILLSSSLTGFYTKPFKYSPRLTITPMVAVSAPFASMSLTNNDGVQISKDLMFIGGPSFTYNLTQRFALNLGATAVTATIKDFPILMTYMIGGRMSF